MLPEWLTDAADLLAEPDPGPTPWLIEDLIVDGALVAAVGRWKTTKSYAMLHLAISVATGRPAFDQFAVPSPGPVVIANEESGRAAMWRRLDALARGYAIDREELRGRLLLAPNARVRLDDREWQERLLELGTQVRPRLFVFDPLARMKAPARQEKEQVDMAIVIEFWRQLRDETGAAVAIVHHTGHYGGHMRGTSDLETCWETRLSWAREPDKPEITIESEHREVENSAPISYKIAFDNATRTIRFPLTAGSVKLEQRIVEWLANHPNSSAEQVAKGLHIRPAVARPKLAALEVAGTTHKGTSGRLDKRGRPIRDKVWNLASQAEPWHVPDAGQPRTSHDPGSVGRSRVPPCKGGRRDEPPDETTHETACGTCGGTDFFAHNGRCKKCGTEANSTNGDLSYEQELADLAARASATSTTSGTTA